MAWARRLLIALAAAVGAGADAPPGLQSALQKIAAEVSGQWNCSVSIAFKSAQGEACAVYGVVDFSTGRKAEVSDAYAWGSVTKVLTGASILKLVSQGAFGLDDPVAPLVDPILAKMAKANPKQGFRSLAELWGAGNISGTTVRQLLSMQAGVPDFDTANPCPPNKPSCVPDDSLRSLLYAHPEHGYRPTELMNVDWVAHTWKSCSSPPWAPGAAPFCYSSTNFMLLGLILAERAGKSSWLDFDEGSHLPESLRGKLQFGKTGAPSKYTHVHGYDRTSYNMPKGQYNDHDNWDVKGVFSGWTASDIVASPSDIATLAWEVYGPPHSIAPEPFVSKMIPPSNAVYGLATFNLTFQTGQRGKLRTAYGHLGATYGYQSIVAYFPQLQFVIAVATNVETDYQNQPAHAMCLSYNTAAGMLLGRTFNCSFQSGGFYGGGCKCTFGEGINAEDVEPEIIV